MRKKVKLSYSKQEALVFEVYCERDIPGLYDHLPTCAFEKLNVLEENLPLFEGNLNSEIFKHLQHEKLSSVFRFVLKPIVQRFCKDIAIT